ncbi:MAG: hypothetical protein KGZ53_02815 [Peptococcaceae bacterium]|nr:hypothetical protein [Peptococcaceae bacterium]
MKKIINGFAYDTDTAVHLTRWQSQVNDGYFSFCSEDLYQTKAGRFFIHGKGGAHTCYSPPRGDSAAVGEAIVSLTKREAQKWIKNRLDIDTYKRLFGPTPRGSDR